MLALTLMVGSAHAWVVKTNMAGEELGWEQSTIGYVLDPTGDHGLSTAGVETAGTSAAVAWDRVPGVVISLEYDGRSATREASYEDDENLVYFEDDWDPQYDGLLAMTSVYSKTDTGEIVGFDIAVNLDYPWTTTGESDLYDLQNSLTHEFGHGLGLDHSADGSATMFASTHKGETDKRTLEIDDEQGARYLYGEAGWVEPGTIACSATGTRSTGPSALFAAILSLALMRRRGGSDSSGDPVDA